MKWVFWGACLLFCLDSKSQKMSLLQYYEKVYQNHPNALQSKLIDQRAQQALNEARGAFDPKIMSDFSTKVFRGKDYYNLWDTYLKIPTALNIDLKAGFERNNGNNVNAENNLPVGGLYYAGMSVPLGRGLFINNNLYQLKTGKITKKNLQNEATIVINNLFLDATYTYWNWYASHEKVRLFEESLRLTHERFQGIKEAVIFGERAAIDSTETKIQVQYLTNLLSKSKLDLQNNLLLLQNMLWDADVNMATHQPDSLSIELQLDWGQIKTFSELQHPDLVTLMLETDQLILNKRYYAEQLKPQIDVNYNFLIQSTQGEAPAFHTSNYKAGVLFSFPLLLRKERAKLKTAKLKILEYEQKRVLKIRQIQNKIKEVYNKINTTREMLQIQNHAISNYQLMLDAERLKFNNGESSIFLINSRQNKLITAQMKKIDYMTSYRIYLGQLLWASGYFKTWLDNIIN